MSIKILLERKMDDFFKLYPQFNDKPINKKFLLFVLFNLLKDLNIEYEEIIDGEVDETNDFGIDAIYIYLSGVLLNEEEDLKKQINKETQVKIVLVQASREDGFSETQLLKMKHGVEEIYDLSKKIKGNPRFLEKAKLIRDVWTRCFDLSSVHLIEIEIIYATLCIDQKVNKKVKELEQKISTYLKSQHLKSFRMKYIGMPELFKIIATEGYDKIIVFKEVTPYSEQYNKGVIGYYGLVKLKDVLAFIINEEGDLVEKYFEGNVRDFYGISKKVNQKIQATIESNKNIMNFWCLNNGLTIICSGAAAMGKRINLTNFHIVNGCQTGHVIYECRDIITRDITGEILVKVIQTEDEKVLNNIIEATNSQTAVSPVSLHSNELIQKNIEELFLRNETPLFYERRINYYKRRNKPINKIISMVRLAQLFYSIFEKKPSIARGRPSELFSAQSTHYERIFNTTFDYAAYLFSYLLSHLSGKKMRGIAHS